MSNKDQIYASQNTQIVRHKWLAPNDAIAKRNTPQRHELQQSLHFPEPEFIEGAAKLGALPKMLFPNRCIRQLVVH